VVFVTHSIREAVFLSERIVVMTPRPGRIVAEIAVPFGPSRNAALRDSHGFADVCAEVNAALHRGMSP
jgi:NitT/TauT family transport system ATP-binding protein